MVAKADEAQKWQAPLPKAVLAQVEEGERLLKEMQEGKLIVHNPDLKPKDKEAEGTIEDVQPEEVEVTQAAPQGTDEWEHKYNVLKGKYDKEGRDYRAKISNLEGQVSSLTETVNNLNDLLLSRRSEPVHQDDTGDEPPVRASTGADFVLDKDDFTSYGPEMEKAAEIINQLSSEVRDLKSKTVREEADAQAQRKAQFDSDLDKACKGWREINADPDFYEGYLKSKYNPVTKKWERISPAHQRLIDASIEMNVEDVAAIFNLYKQVKGISDTGEDETETTTLEDLVVPDVGTGAGAPVRPKTRTVTTEQFQKAVKDRVHGRITEEQYDAIARDYYASQQRQSKSGRKA